MSTSKKTVSKQFSNDFESVAKHYKLRELGQYEEAKAAARRDLESAAVCFAAMAKDIANA
ncbi:MAG TPA: hypothetical protein VIY48_12100 [Candidatus Paceibacterota bacterium]